MLFVYQLASPTPSEKFHLNVYLNQAGRSEYNTFFTSQVSKKWSTTFSAHYEDQSRINDRNNDGFLDTPIRNDYVVYNNLGNAYKEIGNYNDAINAYNNAIKYKPDYSSAHYNLGIVYQKDNDFDTALKSYKKAARLAHSGVQKWLKDGGYYWQGNEQSK